MVASTVRHPKTYEDYLETPDDGQRYELIDGEIVVSAAPVINHQRIVGKLFRMLADVADQNGDEAFVSPVAVTLSPSNTLEPDIVYRSRHNPAIVEDRRILGAPDLIIEVLSPTTASHDQIRKRAVYEAAGVRDYWLVSLAAKSIVVLGLDRGEFNVIKTPGVRITSVAVPELSVDVVSLFAMLP